jgi:hypothetical protein
MYSLFVNRDKLKIRVTRGAGANLLASAMKNVCTVEPYMYNDSYWLCNTPDKLLEMAKEFKEKWRDEITTKAAQELDKLAALDVTKVIED